MFTAQSSFGSDKIRGGWDQQHRLITWQIAKMD